MDFVKILFGGFTKTWPFKDLIYYGFVLIMVSLWAVHSGVFIYRIYMVERGISFLAIFDTRLLNILAIWQKKKKKIKILWLFEIWCYSYYGIHPISAKLYEDIIYWLPW